MAIDWDKRILAPLFGVFGEDATYAPAKGSPFTICGVFDHAYREVTFREGVPAATETPVLGVRLADFPENAPPIKGDTVAIPRLKTVYIVKEVRKDGHGEAKLMLNRRNETP